jgi:outer membrane receptor protein involved in Fe transport
MRLRVLALSVVCALLAALPMLAQGIPTGTLSGHVASPDGQALPGVTVTATSPSLQGTRSVTTNGNGDYLVPSLPAGEYQVTIQLEGFQEAKREVKVSAAQQARVDVDLQISGVSEQIVVTGANETISATPQASTTFEKKFVAALPVERDLRNTVLLTPGATETGPVIGTARTRAISISGAQSYENLFLVNGVVVNENLRGQALPLFIEDAVQETTISTAGISAEYGRFGGGVVNVLTKSGGNELSGSFRSVLTNDSWSGKTPLTVNQVDTINKRYEGTLGGFLLRDRLWYFLAGRDFKDSRSLTTVTTNLPYDDINNERRYEGKLTLSPWTGQRLVASYIKIDADENGNSFGNIMDLASLVNNRKTPQDLRALNYSGVFTDNFFVEAQYSKRKFTFENSGSLFTDLVQGTLLVDGTTNFRYNSPTFCGICRVEKRDNDNKLVKASWFLSTGSLGSHDISAGYDTFSDVRVADNHQSGSDFRIILLSTFIKNGTIYPQILTDDPKHPLNQYIQWNPILLSSRGTDFTTNSFYLNDKWRLNDHWSFNLGVRYDGNDGRDSQGQKTAKDSRVSPRLSAAYDAKGDGDWLFNASYGHYVTALANSQGDSTSIGGNPATYRFNYLGPSINANPNGTLISTPDAIRQIFNWFSSVGGTSNTDPNVLRLSSIPGGTLVVRGSLDSPYTQEYSLGFSKRLGSAGLFRTDYVHRDSKGFYSQRTDLTTGHTAAGDNDLTLLENSDSGLSRVYDGLFTQFQVRSSDRITLGGFWTWSHLRGNVDGETVGSGPVAATLHSYPEYVDARWTAPRGDLLGDQRHRVRIWALFDIFKTDHNALSLSLLESYASGVPYGAQGLVSSKAYVQNPGYLQVPATFFYYYTARDAFRTQDITATDIALNYSFRFDTWGKGVEIFVQPQILNVLNEKGVTNVNVTVRDPTTTKSLKPFNPFTEGPVEGVNWQKGPNFGKPVRQEDYQQPRTVRLSVGFRF